MPVNSSVVADQNGEYDDWIELFNKSSFPVNPYLSYESFSPMYVNSDRFIDKERFTLGFEYKISKKQAIEAEYIYQRDYVSDIQIISINYFFSFFK